MFAFPSWFQVHNNLINAKSELPAFLIKPVQRICKYPLLLDVSNLFICWTTPFSPSFAVLSQGINYR